MRMARVRTPSGARPALLRGAEWREIDELWAARPRETGRSWPVAGTALAAPSEPRVVVGMSHNGSPSERARPPQAFLKSARTVVGPGAAIVLDEGIGSIAVEGELALVIGRRARHLSPDEALDAVLGVTIANDVTAVDQVALDSLFSQGKNGEGFTPLGPWIETDFDPLALSISMELDGVVVAQSSTALLAWNIVEQLVYLSSIMELGPGDVVLTGAPGTTVPVSAGQACRITIDGIGALENHTVMGGSRASVLLVDDVLQED